MENRKIIISQNDKDKIDLVMIFHQLWLRKRLLSITGSIGIILGIIVAFSIPKTYQTSVILAPELNAGSNTVGNLSDLASMVGVNLNTEGSSVDAIYPEIYPQIIRSVPFLTSMFKVPVVSEDKDINHISLYEYIKSKQKVSWWTKIIPDITKTDTGQNINLQQNKINNFKLSKEQDGIANAIKGMMTCSVDKKTYVITLTVTAQDPVVSAALADTVQSKLQQYVINYRTQKARNDLAYALKLFSEAKSQYVKAQERYASYSDANEDLILESFKSKQDEMENEMQLRYNIYNQLAQQVQMARAKVQERTPAFTQIQPATVPLKKAGPKRMTIIFSFVFIDFILMCIYILVQNARKH
jgi:LPS O-antigen subunit length determinant protein (WzzB/FepE family)